MKAFLKIYFLLPINTFQAKKKKDVTIYNTKENLSLGALMFLL